MKKILFVINYLILDDEGGNSRFMYLANKLVETGEYEVEIVTSKFFHAKKRFRDNDFVSYRNGKIRVKFVHELGYKKNISLKRIFSNRIFAKSVQNYLNNISDEEQPDLIYFSVPSLEYGVNLIKFAKQNKIPTIVDIQDIWPEAFEMVSPLPGWINKIIFYQFNKMSTFIYQNTDKVFAVSNTYAKIADQYREKRDSTIVYLGSDFTRFDSYFKKDRKDNVIKFVYLGTLGHSYDLDTVLQALKLLKETNRNMKFEFHILGSGPLENELRRISVILGLSSEVVFHGRLPYSEMVKMLGKFDIAFNPIRDGAAQSIINKVGDYAAAGLPVINTQQNEEYRDLVESYNIGINTTNNPEKVLNAILEMIMDIDRLDTYSKNNRALGESLFNRKVTYNKLCCEIYSLIENHPVE